MGHVFVADTHFGHKFMAELRGYDTVEDHDEAMLDRLNGQIHRDSIVWILGDIGIRTNEATLDTVSRIKGRKMLISGNHDSTHPMHRNAWKHQAKALRVFEYVSPFQRLKLGGYEVMLSHFPYKGDHYDADRYEPYRLRDEGFPLLCGHVHHAWKFSGNQWNVGVDVNELVVTDDMVTDWIDEMEESR